MSKLKLPKKYISVSQIQLWKKDREKYISRYFLNIPEAPSIYADFGKLFAEATETYIKEGKIKNILPYFYGNEMDKVNGWEAEKQVAITVNDLTILGYIDAYCKKQNKVIDFKTSGRPWNIDQVRDSLQLKIYSMAIFVEHGEIPEVQINYLETKKVKNEIQFTGKFWNLNHKFTINECLAAVDYMHAAAVEISEEYCKFL